MSDDGLSGHHDRIVCTLGVHRSGTSLVSRLLNILGVELGAEALVSTTGDDNPTGYWEHPSFVAINDAILERFGGAWDTPPDMPERWASDDRLIDLKSRARELVTTDFSGASLWGWKDPRTCLTLPFWHDVVGPLQSVVCIRNPLAVMASLTDRNGMTRDWAERLWLAYTRASLTHTNGCARLFVFYDDLIDDWEVELGRIAAFIGVPEPARDPRIRDLAARFVERPLCHHRSSTEALIDDPGISYAAKALYLALRDCAVRRDVPLADRDRADPALLQSLGSIGTSALEVSERAAATIAERNRLRDEVREQAAAIDSLNAQAVRLRSDISTLVQETSSLQWERDDAQKNLRLVHSSAAWRVVTSVRRVLDVMMPLGSRRRRLFQTVANRLAGRPAPRKPRRSVVGST